MRPFVVSFCPSESAEHDTYLIFAIFAFKKMSVKNERFYSIAPKSIYEFYI